MDRERQTFELLQLLGDDVAEAVRWLLQEGVGETTARVVRESLLRLERLPLFLRCPSLPACDPRTRVSVAVSAIDLLSVEAHCRYVATLGEAEDAPDVEDEAVPE